MLTDRLYADDQRDSTELEDSRDGTLTYTPGAPVPQPETYDSYLTYQPVFHIQRSEITSPKHINAIKDWMQREGLNLLALSQRLGVNRSTVGSGCDTRNPFLRSISSPCFGGRDGGGRKDVDSNSHVW
jgi:hypothetical protein